MIQTMRDEFDIQSDDDGSRKTDICLITTPVYAAVYPHTSIISFSSVSHGIKYFRNKKMVNSRIIFYNHKRRVFMSVYFGETGELYIDHNVFSIHSLPTPIQPFPRNQISESGYIINLTCGEIVDSYDNTDKIRGIDYTTTRNSLINCAMVERKWYESDDIIVVSNNGHIYYYSDY